MYEMFTGEDCSKVVLLGENKIEKISDPEVKKIIKTIFGKKLMSSTKPMEVRNRFVMKNPLGEAYYGTKYYSYICCKGPNFTSS